MLYRFDAEHISRPTAVSLVRELEDKDIEVEHADMSPWFANQMFMIVTCDEAVGKQICARIWELNNGAYCRMIQCTQQELDSYL